MNDAPVAAAHSINSAGYRLHPEMLASIRLSRGAHTSPAAGLCYVEAKAYLWGLPHSDRPDCMSPVLASMGGRVNDLLSDDLRQRLVPLLSVSPYSANDGLDEQRRFMALDWMICTWLPAWLDLVPKYQIDATALRKLGPIVDLTSAKRAQLVVHAIREVTTLALKSARVVEDSDFDFDLETVADSYNGVFGAAVALWSATHGAATWGASDVAKDVFKAAAWNAWVAAQDAIGCSDQGAIEDSFASTVASLHESIVELYAAMTRLGTEESAVDVHRSKMSD